MMKRAEKVKQKAKEMISSGQKPSAAAVSEATGFPDSDVHRCLNLLEREKEIETYTKEIFGNKHRFIAVKRD